MNGVMNLTGLAFLGATCEQELETTGYYLDLRYPSILFRSTSDGRPLLDNIEELLRLEGKLRDGTRRGDASAAFEAGHAFCILDQLVY